MIVPLRFRQHTVDEPTRVVPGDVVSGIRLVRGLVRAQLADVEQLAQILAEQLPREVVRRFTFAAVDHETADTSRLEQRLKDLEVGQIDQDLLAVLGRQRFAGCLVHVRKPSRAAARASVGRVDGGGLLTPAPARC